MAKYAAIAQSDRPAIAVLPFANMCSDAAEDYFSDGISEDVAATALSRAATASS